MIGDIREHLAITPFRPFRIRTADGRDYPGPTVDHLYFPPGTTSVVVASDRGYVAVLPDRQISGIVHSARKEGPEDASAA